MNKRTIRFVFIGFVLLAILLCLLLFCGRTASAPMDPLPANPIGVTLEVLKADESTAKIRITQSGGEPTGSIEYGGGFWLETFVGNGEWQPLPTKENTAFAAVAYMLMRDSEIERNVNFEWLYGELAPGKYRFCMEFVDFRGTGDYDVYPCYAEFEVK